MNKPKTHYRYNHKAKHFQATNPNHKPSRKLEPSLNVEKQWIPIDEIVVPDYVRQRINSYLMYRDNSARKHRETSKPLYWIELKVSLEYITKVLKNYFKLKANQELQTVDDRLDLVESVLDQSLADLKLAYGDTDNKGHDNTVVGDYLIDYTSRYLYKDFSEKYMKVIDLLVGYVVAAGVSREEKAQQNFEDKPERVEDLIKCADLEDDDYCIDDYLKIRDKTTIEITKSYKIRNKPSKRYPLAPVWSDYNQLKIDYDDMSEEQQAQYDNMEALYEEAKQLPRGSYKQKQLNTMAKNIKESLKHQINKEVGRAVQTNNNDIEYIDLIADKILENFDYTNQKHVTALLTLYFDLWAKYKDAPGHRIYILLKEFKDNINQVKFMNGLHKDIVDAFLHNSSNGKKNIEYLQSTYPEIKTETMNRKLKGSISERISRHFQKMSGS